MNSRNLSVAIAASPATVYEFVTDLSNLPREKEGGYHGTQSHSKPW